MTRRVLIGPTVPAVQHAIITDSVTDLMLLILNCTVESFGRLRILTVLALAVSRAEGWRRLVLFKRNLLITKAFPVRLILNIVDEIVVVGFLGILAVVHVVGCPLSPVFGVRSATVLV